MKRIINFLLGKMDQPEVRFKNDSQTSKKSNFSVISSHQKDDLIEIIANDDQDDLDLNISNWNELFEESVKLVFENQKASAPLLQLYFDVSKYLLTFQY
jgi:DNA segregation ATPase FtsK/SpoIIIE-like protein